MPEIQEIELLTPDEVAAILRTSRAGLDRMRHRQTSPPYLKVGGRVLYRRDQLVAWIDERAEKGV